MTAWAESRGAVAAIVCEHHGQSDGYLPAPMILASALAARTTSIQIVVAAVVLLLHDPVQLAEEMVVLDIISGGRLSYVAALGYQRDEYEMLGVDFCAAAASPTTPWPPSWQPRPDGLSTMAAAPSP